MNSNAAAHQLASRLRARHRSELTVLLRDHLRGLGEKLDRRTIGSLRTARHVKKHLTRVFDKVGVDTRAQLVSRIA